MCESLIPSGFSSRITGGELAETYPLSMSLPGNPLKEPSNEDYTATDSSEAESDSLPLLEDIHRDGKDAPDQPAFIAAGDKDLQPWAEVKQEVDPNLTIADFHEFLDFWEELDFFDSEDEPDDPGDLNSIDFLNYQA